MEKLSQKEVPLCSLRKRQKSLSNGSQKPSKSSSLLKILIKGQNHCKGEVSENSGYTIGTLLLPSVYTMAC